MREHLRIKGKSQHAAISDIVIFALSIGGSISSQGASVEAHRLYMLMALLLKLEPTAEG